MRKKNILSSRQKDAVTMFWIIIALSGLAGFFSVLTILFFVVSVSLFMLVTVTRRVFVIERVKVPAEALLSIRVEPEWSEPARAVFWRSCWPPTQAGFFAQKQAV